MDLDAAKTSCIGATLWLSSGPVAACSSWVSVSFPTHRLPSCATFSSRVNAESSNSTRSATGRARSCHGLPACSSITAQLLRFPKLSVFLQREYEVQVFQHDLRQVTS